MFSKLLLLPLFLFSAYAQVPCAAAPIVTACLASTQLGITACPPGNYSCLCAAYQAQATCYNNCPQDTRASSAQQQVVANCAAASQVSVQNALTVMTSSAAASQSVTVGTDGVATAIVDATTTESAGAAKTGTSLNAAERVQGGVLAVIAAAVVGAAL